MIRERSDHGCSGSGESESSSNYLIQADNRIWRGTCTLRGSAKLSNPSTRTRWMKKKKKKDLHGFIDIIWTWLPWYWGGDIVVLRGFSYEVIDVPLTTPCQPVPVSLFIFLTLIAFRCWCQNRVFWCIPIPRTSGSHSRKYQSQQDNELSRICIPDVDKASVLT